MSFNSAAQNIRVEGTILRATINNAEGQQVEAELDLNTVIGNDDGHFTWGGAGFGDSAENVRVSFESDQNLPILRAQLRNASGEQVDTDLNLSERIAAQNGQLVFVY